MHDVKLGDADESNIGSATFSHAQPSSGSGARNTSSRGPDSTEFRSMGTFGSRGAMSFVAATMAGLASVGGRSVRGVRDRRGLSLGGSMNDHDRRTFSSISMIKFYVIHQGFRLQIPRFI